MRSLLVVVAALALVACKKPESPTQPVVAAPAAAPGAPAANSLTGKVLEKTDAPPYSYLKLATGAGEVWAAVPQTQAAVGTQVTVANAFPMKDFESKTLNRKFDVVYFGTLGGEAAAAPAPAMPPMGGPGGEAPSPAAMAAQHQAAASAPAVKVGKIAKAGGPEGKTVEEVWTHRTALKEKAVAVKGQVVKFSPGIMNRNWIHLQDGSGNADKKTNDITVTTQDDVKVGDVVTVKGTVRLDKDFGAGYAYPVIIEDAKVSAK